MLAFPRTTFVLTLRENAVLDIDGQERTWRTVMIQRIRGERIETMTLGTSHLDEFLEQLSRFVGNGERRAPAAPAEVRREEKPAVNTSAKVIDDAISLQKQSRPAEETLSEILRPAAPAPHENPQRGDVGLKPEVPATMAPPAFAKDSPLSLRRQALAGDPGLRALVEPRKRQRRKQMSAEESGARVVETVRASKNHTTEQLRRRSSRST